MRISSIGYEVKTKNIPSRNPGFSGIVNGKHYDDEIIKLAKEVMKNPNWQKKYESGKFTLSELVVGYFEGLGNIKHPTTWGRYGLAFLTLGVSELCIAGVVLAGAFASNLYDDIKIQKIKNCIVDLVSESNGSNNA